MSELDRFPVVIETPVVWGDMDAFGHLNNTVYFRYFESGRIAYFERMGIYAKGTPTEVAPILAHTSCRFRAPVTYPDTVRIGTRVADLGADRFTMEYLVYSETLERVAATGDGLVVSFHYGEGRKAPLPTEWRAAIERLEGH